MMPHRSLSTEPPPGSKNAPRDRSTPPNPPSKGQGFTEIKQSHSGDPGQPTSPDGVDPEATEPFPPDLFRLPVQNKVFGQMPEISDAALRCLLALIHQSFRFDPETSTWTCPGKSFSRRDIERKAGLSDQGARNGLASLEEAGWVNVDRSGRGYRYTLCMEVPTQRYTYVPTTLLEKASELPSTTALRAVLAVLRATWGWTSKENGSDEKRSKTVHRRWAEISTSRLSRLTGRSEPALREATSALEGECICRVQPGQGAYLYRLLADAFEPGNKDACEEESRSEKASSNPPTPNEVTPDRQQSYPPSSYKENFYRDKQPTEVDSKENAKTQDESPETDEEPAVPDSQKKSGTGTDTDLSQFSDKKQSLGRKLINAGVWPDRAKECLGRYSAPRIEANFELFRERAPEIEDHGAWLCAAITGGYADLSRGSKRKGLPTGSGEGEEKRSEEDSSSAHNDRPVKRPDHKEKVTARRKHRLIRQHPKIEAEQFHRYRHAESPDTEQFLYFDPAEKGPDRRVSHSQKFTSPSEESSSQFP